jgi:hypothetical protein
MLESRDAHVIRFQCTNRRARECVEALQELGVGYHFGTIDILELKSVLPRLSNHPGGPGWKKSREYNTTNSLTLEEIYESIEKQYRALMWGKRGVGGGGCSVAARRRSLALP